MPCDSKQTHRSRGFHLWSHILVYFPIISFSFSYQIIKTGRRLACWMSCPVETDDFHIRKFQVEKVKLMWIPVSDVQLRRTWFSSELSWGASLNPELIHSSVAHNNPWLFVTSFNYTYSLGCSVHFYIHKSLYILHSGPLICLVRWFGQDGDRPSGI